MAKSFVKSMLSLMLIGALVAATGLALGGSRSIAWEWGRPRVMDTETKTLDVREPLQFTELRLDTSVAELRVETGNAFHIEARYEDGSEIQYELKDGTLRVFDDGAAGRTFRINMGLHISAQNWVTVTIPRGDRLVRASVNSDVGDVYLRGLSVGELSVHSSMGKVDMRDISCDEFDGRVDVSGVYLDNVEAARRFYATTNLGEVKGDASLQGDISIRTDVGAIDLSLSLPRDQYRIDAHTDLGSIALNPIQADPASAPNKMMLRSDMGSISVRFAD